MFLVALLACSPCKEPVTDLTASCELPPELASTLEKPSATPSWWACDVQPKEPLRAIYQGCELSALGSEDAFAWGQNSLAAAAAAQWLRSEELPEGWAASILVDPPVKDIELSEGEGDPLPDWPIWVVTLDGIDGLLVLEEGQLPLQPPARPVAAIPSLQRSGSFLLAAAPGVSDEALSRIAASVDEALQIVLEGDRLAARAIPPWPGKVCTTAWPDMDCGGGLYTDRAPTEQRMSWREARRHCTREGKRLPWEWEIDGPVWTDTWAGESELPFGPCDGAWPCGDRSVKVLGDGTRASIGERHPARCVTHQDWSTEWPPWHLQERAVPPSLEPLSDEQRAMVSSFTEDPIDEKPVCQGFKGHSTLNCRDPNHYVKPNETRQELWYPYIRNLGGGYVGVGSDQGYTFAAIQRAEFAWLMDYDAQVVHVHRVNEVFFERAETRADFVALWADPASADLFRDPALADTFRGYRAVLHRHYSRSLEGETFLGKDEDYTWVRTMVVQGRMVSVKGDMLADGAMRSIGTVAQGLGVPIRVYYTSNAPDAWMGRLTREYKDNVLNLPMDDRSVVLQVFGFPSGPQQEGYWHYNVASGLYQQELIRREGYTFVHFLVSPRLPTDDPDLTVAGLPHTLPYSESTQ